MMYMCCDLLEVIKSSSLGIWFAENFFTNIFTILTVILSGIISYLISKHYFEKSNEVNNRENLKISVIYPLLTLLDDKYTVENYKRILALEKEYSIKYMLEKERQCLANLRLAYKDIAYYSEKDINAKILFSYFERCLELQGIKWEPYPVFMDGEVVAYEPQEGYFELEDAIVRVLHRYDYKYEHEECQEALEALFIAHVRKFCQGQKAVFFKDISLIKIIQQDERTTLTNAKFEKYQLCKKEFLDLPLIKNEMFD